MSAADPRLDLLKQLADPLRLRIIDRLGHLGPASVSELAGELDVPMPQLSNHLRRLRDARLVHVHREGRTMVYELADPGLAALLPLLDRLTARVVPRPVAGVADRTCYGHLAGRLGVGIYRRLQELDAIDVRADGTVALGRDPAPLAAMGVDAGAIDARRRRFAFECLDATEHAGHLGGALGDALATALDDHGWIVRDPESRDVTVTPAGRRALRRTLGLELAG